jgi:hypothetical protein
MKKILSKINHHVSKSVQKHTTPSKKKLGLIFISLFMFGIVSSVSLFFITRGINPETSELAFIENSILGKSAGSVVPASCESAPWITANGDGNVTGCVAAVPGDTVNTCTIGNLGATAEYATAYQWWCNSAGGNVLANRNISAWVSYCTGNYPGAEYQIWQWRSVELNPTQYRWTGAYCYPPTVDIHFN